MILHAVQNSNIPFPFRDWDVDNGTIEDHRARFGAVLREVNSVMAVNFFFNSLLLVPLIYTGQKYLIRKCFDKIFSYKFSEEHLSSSQCLTGHDWTKRGGGGVLRESSLVLLDCHHHLPGLFSPGAPLVFCLRLQGELYNKVWSIL